MLTDTQYFKIYDYTNLKHDTPENLEFRQELPSRVDFKTGLDIRLHHVHTFDKGELKKTTYYANYDVATRTYSTPVLEETNTFTRDTAGFAQHRVCEIRWYLNDGTLHQECKSLLKVYTELEAIDEGIRRRSNIINMQSLTLVGFVMMFEGKTKVDAVLIGRAFAAKYQKQIDAFINTSVKELITCIETDTEFAFLNAQLDSSVSARQYLCSQLNISY